jgi:hypothetical protein
MVSGELGGGLKNVRTSDCTFCFLMGEASRKLPPGRVAIGRGAIVETKGLLLRAAGRKIIVYYMPQAEK